MSRVDPEPSSVVRRIAGIALGVAAWCALAAPAFAAADASPTTATTEPPVTDTTFVWDIDKDPSDCLGFLPKPGCGKEPQQAGDRGGALQWAVFGLILAGVGTVATVLTRNVVRRDKEIADRIADGD